MDIKHIKNLVQLMVENDLSRVELREGDTHILLRRGQAPLVSTAPVSVTPAPSTAPAQAAPPPSPEPDEHYIRSPMVGTFYTSADPETPPFVNIGDHVTAESVVCLVEAMKVFNEIKADVAGRITKVLVKNAQAVEFDQPLFAVAAS
ncbi:MAG: acetyl-CoA carboxylase biotin carboxyl carrier protein [Phycisphaerae bacterium]|jgi:acetyl-CoA carboxylase biotin carboxyl carrier protein